MQTINLETDASRLSEVVEAASQGEEIIISRDGMPIAKLVKLAAPPSKSPRILGRLAGQFVVPDNFDDPLPDDVLASFEGR